MTSIGIFFHQLMMTESLWSVWLLFKSCPLERTRSCLLSSTRCLFSPLKEGEKKKSSPLLRAGDLAHYLVSYKMLSEPRRANRAVCASASQRRRRLWLLPNSRTFRWGYKSRGTVSQVAASAAPEKPHAAVTAPLDCNHFFFFGKLLEEFVADTSSEMECVSA